MASYISYIPALGWLILGLAIILTAYALFADRAKGRRRCPKCWYDMAGLPGPQCPECGHAARNDRALSRTRRRWKRLVFTVPLAIIGYAGIVGPGVLSDGARAIVPNALVALWPLDPRLLVEPDLVPEPIGPVNRFMLKELTRRIDEHRFADWQFDVITGRIRREYTRLGRYGVSDEERAILAKLASTPLTPAIQPANLDDVLQALAAADIPHECTVDPERCGSVMIGFDETGSTNCAIALERLDLLSEDYSWTIRNNIIVIGDRSAVSDEPKIEFVDIDQLAPEKFDEEAVATLAPLTIATWRAPRLFMLSERNRFNEILSDFIEDGRWQSRLFSRSHQYIGPFIRIGGSPLLLEKASVLLAALHLTASKGPGYWTKVEHLQSAWSFQSQDRVYAYNVSDLIPRYRFPPKRGTVEYSRWQQEGADADRNTWRLESLADEAVASFAPTPLADKFEMPLRGIVLFLASPEEHEAFLLMLAQLRDGTLKLDDVNR